ncbi:MAG: transposase [Bacteroidetes bacterium]|nr:transposase [Bacteroidota bacterium]
MQGKKSFTPRLFVNQNVVDLIPKGDFYRILKGKFNLAFIYELTRDCYSHAGKPSLDPVVFFKLVLMGFLENLCSDRSLEFKANMRIELECFLD